MTTAINETISTPRDGQHPELCSQGEHYFGRRRSNGTWVCDYECGTVRSAGGVLIEESVQVALDFDGEVVAGEVVDVRLEE